MRVEIIAAIDLLLDQSRKLKERAQHTLLKIFSQKEFK